MTDTPKPLTDAELDEIAARADSATAGPWRWGVIDEDDIESATAVDSNFHAADAAMEANPWMVTIIKTDGHHYPPSEKDAAFIIASRVDVPRLVAEVRRQRALLRKLVIEEGCPRKVAEVADAGVDVCAFCGGHERPDEPGNEARYDHAAECIWPELEMEVGLG